MSIIPWTTWGRSVHRSSSAERLPDGKSPYSLFSPENVDVPRLWYIVGSLSQLGTFTVASAGSRNVGTYGNETSGSTAGNGSPMKVKSRSSKALPEASL